MKKGVLLLMFSMITLLLNAQSNSSVKTSVEGGRWEIIQSEKARRDTYKLDKYKGDVYQLVQKENGDETWQKLPRVGESDDNLEEGKINFQLFLGGISAQDQFLINIHTGKTWCIYKDTERDMLFLGFIFE